MLLTVDFTLAKVRAQANFADLAGGLPDGPAVWGTEESCWPVTGGDPAIELEQWLRRTREAVGAGGTVRGVLGFCAGAGPAGALAAALAEGDGPPPPLVLLDPVAANAHTMTEQCEAAARRMTATPPQAAPPGTEDLDRLATLLTERYAAVAGPVCAEQRIPAPIVEQLRLRVEANLRYLALCATAGLSRADPALLVLSRDHGVPPRLRGARAVRLEVSQNELLADSGAARAVAGALAATVPIDRL
jgi:hypothetical protein